VRFRCLRAAGRSCFCFLACASTSLEFRFVSAGTALCHSKAARGEVCQRKPVQSLDKAAPRRVGTQGLGDVRPQDLLSNYSGSGSVSARRWGYSVGRTKSSKK
jgi:hypothetical protein